MATMPGMTRSRSGSLVVIAAVVLAGCEEERSGGEEREARPGLVQVGSAEGPLLDEDEACGRLRDALLAASERISCSTLRVAACPELVRAAGTAACTRFSEESVEACEELTSVYETCEDFTQRRCLVVSVLEERSEGCWLPGADAGTDGGTDAGTDAGAPDSGLLDAGMDMDPGTEPGQTPAPVEAGTVGEAGLIDAGTEVIPDSGMDPVPQDAAATEAAEEPTDLPPASLDASADGG